MFSAIHTHSDYSLLESCIQLKNLIPYAKSLGYQAVALTDHNSLGGVVEFYRLCQEHDIKAIIGMESDVVGFSGLSKVVLLAENNEGYHNLLELASQKPPITEAMLHKYGTGLISLIGCEDLAMVSPTYERFASILGCKQVYLELLVSTASQRALASELIKRFPNYPFVASQNVYYLESQDQQILQVMKAIKDGKALDEVDMGHCEPLYSVAELQTVFAQMPKALDTMEDLGARCDVQLVVEHALPTLADAPHLPDSVWEAARKRYQVIDETIRTRIQYELDVIHAMGFDDYFMIVSDIVAYAKAQKIPVGPGRGSVAGSLVAYVLGITEIDPLKYQLVFERFLNKHRHTMPDIDLDFCYLRRPEILAYIAKRFGSSHVAQIGTYGTFGYRLAVREVGRVFGLSKSEIDQQLESKSQGVQPAIEQIVQGLIGLKRHFSTHAAGILITPKPIRHYCACQVHSQGSVTQISMDSVAHLGLLKVDVLGLRTLTLLADAQEQVAQIEPGFSLDTIATDDRRTYQLLSTGQTLGVFQMESPMFQDVLRRFQPTCFADIIALLALCRPGPISHIPTYIARKNHPPNTQHRTEQLAEILADTHGLMIYQEQVMQVAHQVGQLSLEEADLLRMAMSKKNRNELLKLKHQFIEGSLRVGFQQEQAHRIFADLERFADYAFNKAHSTAYAWITYQTAYLKANYPLQFYLAQLKHVTDQRKRVEYLLECRKRRIVILPPDIRYSQAHDSLEGSSIRIGLGTLKDVSLPGANHLITRYAPRESKMLDFYLRSGGGNGKILYTLALAGAFDSLLPRGRALRSIRQFYQLPHQEFSELELLRAEKEIVGLYLSEHPVNRWESFIEKIGAAFPHHITGEVWKCHQQGSAYTGDIIGFHESIAFTLPKECYHFHDYIHQGALVALFGAIVDEVLVVQWVLPLRPLLMVQPIVEKLGSLQKFLRAHKGNTPVVLNLKRGSIQLVPPQLWMNVSSQMELELAAYCTHCQWVDPWTEISR